ncbi:coiled-coil domain-containing protein 178 [Perognathus longimembris pacificus]|uniref:coiled-coil domain-containing protein 178 n=1 Tax=Perognathus longimembris pacificus TaxID=214514 RepID=UPI0020184171|nr:coiled-coil domain-containing protein 178 [Perognathus longimembris pacificus]
MLTLSRSVVPSEVGKGIYYGYPSRRHSCSQVNIPAPCVTKTISHIEDIESKIQDHLKQFETSLEEWTRISSIKDMEEDMTIAIPVKKAKSEDRDVTCPELKEKMKTLLSELINLIQSLETDRAIAELALKQQKSRRKKISMRIDSWSIWKIQELPLAVQREHEAYVKDIIELRWHLEDKGYQVESLEKQKNKFEEANRKLEEDIKHMIESAVLLDSKQKQEDEALKQQYLKKAEVLELLRKVNEELKKSKKEFETAKSDLQLMRENMEKSIADEEVNIEAYTKEMSKLKNIFTHYSTSIHDVHVEIKKSEEKVDEIMKESKSTTVISSDLKKMLDDLKRVFEQISRKHKKIEKNYLEALNNYYATKRTWDIELSNIMRDYTEMSKAYDRIVEENKKFVTDMDSMAEKITESMHKKIEYESDIQSFHRMKKKNSVYLKDLYEESYRIGTIFAITKHKTEEMEDKVAEVRRKFKGREEFLKKLTRGEVAAGIVIQKRLFAIEENHLIERQNLVRKKVLFTIALDEVEEPLTELEGEAIKIRVIHREQYDTLTDILQRKNKVRHKVEKTKKKLHKKEKKSRSALTETAGKRSTIFKELEEARSKTVLYNERAIDITKELNEIEEEKIKMEKELEVLNKQFYDLRLEKELIQTAYDHVVEEKSKCDDRLYKEGQKFRKLVHMRQKSLANICKTQEDLLKENHRLAQEYQRIQSIYSKEKDAFLNIYDRQRSLHASVSDKKEFCQLQRNLHKEWQKYFRLMVVYSQMRLANLQKESLESIQKILAVQETCHSSSSNSHTGLLLDLLWHQDRKIATPCPSPELPYLQHHFLNGEIQVMLLLDYEMRPQRPMC